MGTRDQTHWRTTENDHGRLTASSPGVDQPPPGGSTGKVDGEKSTPREISSSEALSILLIEDSDADVTITRRAFREGGLAVDLQVVRDGEEALEYLGKQQDPGLASSECPRAVDYPDLIFLDMNLPRMTGKEVLERIRGLPDVRLVPVIVLTTSKRLEDVQAMYESGANSYIQKPQDFSQFVEVLKITYRYWSRVVERPGN